MLPLSSNEFTNDNCDVKPINCINADVKYSLVKVNDEKWKNFPKSLLPIHFNDATQDKLKKIQKFSLFDDDVFIIGFPRSGTTRLQEMVWLILNDFNFQMAREYDADVRCPFFELSEWSFLHRNKKIANSLEEKPRPRMMKSHLPVQLLPDEVWTKKPKIFYISREVKDVAISFYHYMKGQARKNFTQDEFLDAFLNDTYLTYESMSEDMDGAIRNVSEFLGKTVSEENSIKLKEHLRYEKIKESNATNNKDYLQASLQVQSQRVRLNPTEFIRKGIVGDFINEMSEDSINKSNDWIAESRFLNQGFKFKEANNDDPQDPVHKVGV